ncbi:MAG: SH3 domain-containing protein [Anaerolineae bacterium]|nr:SH3 domain-containing protein [Anaerolineae bacterium]
MSFRDRLRITLLVVILSLLAACTSAEESPVPTRAVLPSVTPGAAIVSLSTVSTVEATAVIMATSTLPATVPPTASPTSPPTSSTATDTPFTAAPTSAPTTRLIVAPTPSSAAATTTPPAASATPSPEAATPVPTREVRQIGAAGFPTPLITAIRLETATPTPSATPQESPTPSTTPFPTPIGEASVTTASQQVVNLMQEPSHTSTIIRAVASGENIFLIGRAWNNEWYQVRLMDGVEGWIYALYLVVWIDTSRLVVTHLEPTRPPVAMVGSFALGGHVMNLNEDAFGTMRQAGMTWLKVQHRYHHGERGSAVAPIVNAAHRAGFRILLGVVGERGQLASIPNYHAAFADFVAGAALAGADAIEIWNEPNIDREWPRGFIHGGNYTDLLRASYNAIKAVSPVTIVVSAAPAPTGFFGPAGCGDGGCNDDIFLKQMAFAGAQNFLDCVGLHHNDGIVSPTQRTGDPRGDHPTYFLSGVISRVPSEFNSRPLCFTEVGYLSPEGYGTLPPNFAWAAGTSVAEHAQWLGEAVQVARTSGRVQMLIVWNIDFNVYTYEDPMAGYAIRRRDGGCPACAALAAAIR